MLQISRARFDALRDARRRAFIAEMVSHSRARFPHITKSLADDQLQPIVEQRVTDALDAGFRLRGMVRLHLELSFILGVDFASDPQFPWAGEILSLPEVVTEQRRARKLCEATREYLAAVHGPGGRYAERALQDLEYVAEAGFTISRADNLEDGFFRLLNSIYPEKAREAGRTAMRRLLARACEEADQRSLTTPRHRLLVGALMLAFGHGCFHDQVHPWIAASVDASSANGEERGARLERRALTLLKTVNHGRTSSS